MPTPEHLSHHVASRARRGLRRHAVNRVLSLHTLPSSTLENALYLAPSTAWILSGRWWRPWRYSLPHFTDTHTKTYHLPTLSEHAVDRVGTLVASLAMLSSTLYRHPHQNVSSAHASRARCGPCRGTDGVPRAHTNTCFPPGAERAVDRVGALVASLATRGHIDVSVDTILELQSVPLEPMVYIGHQYVLDPLSNLVRVRGVRGVACVGCTFAHV
eukprot:359013-Chlamydomonas_euryale.AAC.10